MEYTLWKRVPNTGDIRNNFISKFSPQCNEFSYRYQWAWLKFGAYEFWFENKHLYSPKAEIQCYTIQYNRIQYNNAITVQNEAKSSVNSDEIGIECFYVWSLYCCLAELVWVQWTSITVARSMQALRIHVPINIHSGTKLSVTITISINFWKMSTNIKFPENLQKLIASEQLSKAIKQYIVATLQKLWLQLLSKYL